MMNSKLSLATLMAVASIAACEQSVRNDTVQDVPQHSRGRSHKYGAQSTRSPSDRQRRRSECEAARNAKQLAILNDRAAKRSRKACE
jgi:hypothetical protein